MRICLDTKEIKYQTTCYVTRHWATTRFTCTHNPVMLKMFSFRNNILLKNTQISHKYHVLRKLYSQNWCVTITNDLTPKFYADLPTDSNRHLWEFVGALCYHNVNQTHHDFIVLKIFQISEHPSQQLAVELKYLYAFLFFWSQTLHSQ
jgi:hypothetical protein